MHSACNRNIWILFFMIFFSILLFSSPAQTASAAEIEVKSEDRQARSEQKTIDNSDIISEFEKATSSKLKDIFGDDYVEILKSPNHRKFREPDKQVNAFFSYLDKQDYITLYNLSNGTKQLFQILYEKLLANSPITLRETDKIDFLLQNAFYFHRNIRHDDISLIKDILRNESDIIEPMMRVFYLWTSNSKLRPKDLSQAQLYEFSSFFLETLGGRSYLFRRHPKVRILLQYYCILNIDKANDNGLNLNGVDIRPHLRLTMDEVLNQKDLFYKQYYLYTLNDLIQKY